MKKTEREKKYGKCNSEICIKINVGDGKHRNQRDCTVFVDLTATETGKQCRGHDGTIGDLPTEPKRINIGFGGSNVSLGREGEIFFYIRFERHAESLSLLIVKSCTCKIVPILFESEVKFSHSSAFVCV